jgi:hypothetical protein
MARGACCFPPARARPRSGLAHLLHTQREDLKVVGLTSAANAGFVNSLGCYDEVVTYDRVGSLPPDRPVAFVDMTGNSELRARQNRADPRQSWPHSELRSGLNQPRLAVAPAPG